MGRRLPKCKWPKYLKPYKVIKGIYMGGCRDGRCWKKGSAAHAHTDPSSPHHGWICVRIAAYVRSGNLLRHELAHLLAPAGSGHDKIWKDTLIKIGGTIKPYGVWVGNRRFVVPAYKKRRGVNEWAPVLRKKKKKD